MNAFVNLSDNVFGIRLLYFKLVFQLRHKSLDRGIFLHCFGVSHGQTNLQENCTVKFITIKKRFVKVNLGYRLTCPFLVGLTCYDKFNISLHSSKEIDTSWKSVFFITKFIFENGSFELKLKVLHMRRKLQQALSTA